MNKAFSFAFSLTIYSCMQHGSRSCSYFKRQDYCRTNLSLHLDHSHLFADGLDHLLLTFVGRYGAMKSYSLDHYGCLQLSAVGCGLFLLGHPLYEGRVSLRCYFRLRQRGNRFSRRGFGYTYRLLGLAGLLISICVSF